MGISPSLEIAKRALIAQRLGLDATSGNIANVNTPGYSRRVPNFTEGEPLPSRNGFVGNGVLVSKLRTFREEFFDRQIRRSYSHLSTLETDDTIVQRLSVIFGEPGENSLNSIVSEFFNSFEDLTYKPTDVSLRQRTINIAQTMVLRFREIASQLQETRSQIYKDASDSVTQANKLIKEIANLNYKIASTKSKLEGDNQTLFDQRATKVEELSKLLDINITQGDYGTINVFANGINLVTGTNYNQLKLKETVDQVTQERTISLLKTDPSGKELATINLQNGKIFSLIEHYNSTFDDKDSSGKFSVATTLEKFFATLVNRVNSLAETGYGLDDSGASPPGRAIFTYVGNLSIASTSVNSQIVSDPRKLPISSNPNENGNALIAKQISAISNDNTFLDNQKPDDYLTNLIGQIGSLGEQISNLYTISKTANEQLLNQRESLIGVNLDEEAINLMKFQKAFEAASRVVTTTNDILATLVNLGR
ncbi:MAG: flagellar hook-associated protein FlgK [Ignavibacteria bacterium]|nr:flagellar hook-associated protein FlgK [Ignavibacteria bacterium]